VTGHIDLEVMATREVELVFSGTTFSGLWGSDGTIEGCGTFAGCEISGEPVSGVPEPSSFPMFLAGLGLIGGAFYFGRKRARAS